MIFLWYFINACRLCMQFYTAAKQNIHFKTKFCRHVCENDKILLFNQDNAHPFLSVPSVVFTSNLYGGCETENSRFVCFITTMQTWRWTELLQMLVIASHVQSCSQSGTWWSLPPACWCILVVALAMVCRATFISSVILGFGCSL